MLLCVTLTNTIAGGYGKNTTGACGSKSKSGIICSGTPGCMPLDTFCVCSTVLHSWGWSVPGDVRHSLRHETAVDNELQVQLVVSSKDSDYVL